MFVGEGNEIWSHAVLQDPCDTHPFVIGYTLCASKSIKYPLYVSAVANLFTADG